MNPLSHQEVNQRGKQNSPMYQPIRFKTKILSTINSINRSPLRYGFLLIALAWFALSPTAQAACQDDCLPNHNTVQGDDALISLTTGNNNTANGFMLSFQHHRRINTANGAFALAHNTTGTSTRPTVFLRSKTTQPASPTRPMVFRRSLTKPPATLTRPTVLTRSLPMQPAC